MPSAQGKAHVFPSGGRLAAIDFGTVRIGIAVCDPDWILASPLEIWQSGSDEENEAYFRDLAKRERLAGLVVGLPIHNDGGESEKSLLAREFARSVGMVTGLPVRLFDERFTTVAATQRLGAAGYTRKRKKARLDAVAAQVILESFLEACRYRGEIAGEPAVGDGEDLGS
ncbi:MAG: Holliday junction resolvase RuvX [Planctomycetota bacterium]